MVTASLAAAVASWCQLIRDSLTGIRKHDALDGSPRHKMSRFHQQLRENVVKIGFAFAIQSFVDCAHYFINLMKHFMHCWKYFSYIFSILLSSWFMLSSSAFYIGLLWLLLHAQNPEQDHKTYRRFLVSCCIALHTTKSESGRQRVVVIACPIHQLRNGANSLCVSIGGAFNVSENHDRHTERDEKGRETRRRGRKWSKKCVPTTRERDKSSFNWLRISGFKIFCCYTFSDKWTGLWKRLGRVERLYRAFDRGRLSI